MAQFSQMNLAVLNFANGFTLWHYRAIERRADSSPTGSREGRWLTKNEILAPGHFDPAAGTLAQGDMIVCQFEYCSAMTLMVFGEPGKRTAPGEGVVVVAIPGSVLDLSPKEKAA